MIYFASVSFAVGIILGRILNADLAISLELLLVSLVCFLFLWRSQKARVILFCIMATSAGMARFQTANVSPDPKLLSSIQSEVSLTGEITEEADERDLNSRYVLDIDGSKSRILLVTDRFPEFAYGDKISVSGTLELPKNFEGDTGIEFDYVSYLLKDGVHFVMYRPNIEKVGDGGSIVFKNLFKLKNYFSAKVSDVVPEPNASLVNGLIFGAKQSLGESLLSTMKNVGLIHIVAISGYNVTVIAIAILYMTSYLGKRNLGLLLSALCIILFALMVGFGSTVIRASIMAVIAILAQYLGRQTDALRALFIAGILMIIWNPFILTSDPSFQLSFMATLGLILFSPIIKDFLFAQKYKKYFCWIPEKFGLREIVSSTLSVQIFLLPMLLKMSGVLSLVSFFLNLVVLPIVPGAMLAGFITGFAGIFSRILSWPFGALSYLLTEIIIRLAEFAEKIPLAFVRVGSFPDWAILVCYVFYAWVFWKFSSITSQFKFAKKSSI